MNKKILIISKISWILITILLVDQKNCQGTTGLILIMTFNMALSIFWKRVLDTLVSICLILLLSPVFILVFIYILYLDGFPVIIKQNRIGLHGKQFSMYKFRTMKINSHEMRENLKEQNQHDEEIFKINDDPRVLDGAKFLRNFSLDELPQFINVLKGNMSIVGPRPLFDEDTKLFNENYMRRLNVLPGITGLLQINDRNTSEFSTWYKYDIEYIDNWTLFLDLKIQRPLALIRSSKGI